jgi:hypothetical protein
MSKGNLDKKEDLSDVTNEKLTFFSFAFSAVFLVSSTPFSPAFLAPWTPFSPVSFAASATFFRFLFSPFFVPYPRMTQ